jgi:hypothetical protein
MFFLTQRAQKNVATMTEENPINQTIKNEADAILYQKGLHKILSKYGTPHISGSYALDLMAWRDLDIYLETENTETKDFFTLGAEINALLQPVKMSFRNELIKQTKGLPLGLYWGIYLGNERAGDWKIDLWLVDSNECNRLLQFCGDIEKELNSENRKQILEIKSRCWMDPEYRYSYTSIEIYHAVLNKGITEIDGFKKWLSQKTGANQ